MLPPNKTGFSVYAISKEVCPGDSGFAPGTPAGTMKSVSEGMASVKGTSGSCSNGGGSGGGGFGSQNSNGQGGGSSQGGAGGLGGASDPLKKRTCGGGSSGGNGSAALSAKMGDRGRVMLDGAKEDGVKSEWAPLPEHKTALKTAQDQWGKLVQAAKDWINGAKDSAARAAAEVKNVTRPEGLSEALLSKGKDDDKPQVQTSDNGAKGTTGDQKGMKENGLNPDGTPKEKGYETGDYDSGVGGGAPPEGTKSRDPFDKSNVANPGNSDSGSNSPVDIIALENFINPGAPHSTPKEKNPFDKSSVTNPGEISGLTLDTCSGIMAGNLLSRNGLSHLCQRASAGPDGDLGPSNCTGSSDQVMEDLMKSGCNIFPDQPNCKWEKDLGGGGGGGIGGGGGGVEQQAATKSMDTDISKKLGASGTTDISTGLGGVSITNTIQDKLQKAAGDLKKDNNNSNCTKGQAGCR